VIDRALGDIHPSGNPHVHLDPRNIAKVGEGVITTRPRRSIMPTATPIEREPTISTTAGIRRCRNAAEAQPRKDAGVVYH